MGRWTGANNVLIFKNVQRRIGLRIDFFSWRWNLAEWLERLIANDKVATFLGLTQHPPIQWNLRGRQMKQRKIEKNRLMLIWIQTKEKLLMAQKSYGGLGPCLSNIRSCNETSKWINYSMKIIKMFLMFSYDAVCSLFVSEYGILKRHSRAF